MNVISRAIAIAPRALLLVLLPWILLLGCQPAAAQFTGYVSPQTVNQKVFNGASGPGTFIVANVGQTSHELCWTTGNNSNLVMQIRLDASFDGVSYFPLSDDGTQPISGCVYGQGSYPYVRANLIFLSGSILSASYTGTSATSFPITGALAQSQQYRKVLGNLVTNATAINLLNAPCGNTSGVLVFTYATGQGVGSVTISPAFDTATPAGGGNYTFNLASVGTAQTFYVPFANAISLGITWNANAGSTFSANYAFNCPAVLPASLQPYSAIQPANSNKEVTALAGPATVTFTGNPGQRVSVFNLSAACSAGTAGLTITDGGTTIWSTPATAIGTTKQSFPWNPGLAGAVGNTYTITLSTCGGGNTGTLDVQASQN